MKHMKPLGTLPQYAQGEGLCDNITTTTQARYCFVLSFLTDFVVPLVQPFILWKTLQDEETATGA
ncbi:MAG: hypothetical protein BWX80_03137 [Candidatus Hydrogenedentes bacterium ADurb.Bin101]|nr:MAG: hypothetical protein BWX80_03137 [Candidatus Hydrogenedentes bacterium ADurb.Bin101]